jgi:hypothetical protein
MRELSIESGQRNFVLPVGLCSVIDKENGGDTTAEELVGRFNLLETSSHAM